MRHDVSGRWLVTGAGGMLGRDLTATLTSHNAQLTALDRAGLDIGDPAAVAAAVKGHDIVLNAAAWTDVDGAEAAEDAATAINGTAVATLAQACADAGAVLVHVSTDYVFPGEGYVGAELRGSGQSDVGPGLRGSLALTPRSGQSDVGPGLRGSGQSPAPYPETAATAPINAYGRSKLAGELAVRDHLPSSGYLVRTAWLYGEHGKNFVATMLDLAAKRETVDVVDDQHGQPTWSGALAVRLVQLGAAALAGSAPAGIYHGTASGQTTWYGLARAVFAGAGLDPDRVRPTTSAAFVRPAARPSYSVLGHERWADAGLPPMADWQDMLTTALAQPGFAAKIAAR